MRLTIGCRGWRGAVLLIAALLLSGCQVTYGSSVALRSGDPFATRDTRSDQARQGDVRIGGRSGAQIVFQSR